MAVISAGLAARGFSRPMVSDRSVLWPASAITLAAKPAAEMARLNPSRSGQSAPATDSMSSTPVAGKPLKPQFPITRPVQP